jgi:ABC-type sugar transport system ATPase subunit
MTLRPAQDGPALGRRTAPALEMRGIRKAFPGVIALDDVELTLYAGEVHVLLGENGAGKSTLMKILSGAYRRDAGTIQMNGSEVAIGSPRDALAHGIRVIYQELNLVPLVGRRERLSRRHPDAFARRD